MPLPGPDCPRTFPRPGQDTGQAKSGQDTLAGQKPGGPGNLEDQIRVLTDRGDQKDR